MIVGVVVAFLPYLGIPPFWKRFLITLGGIVVVFFALLLRLTMQSIRAKLHSLDTRADPAPVASPAPEPIHEHTA